MNENLGEMRVKMPSISIVCSSEAGTVELSLSQVDLDLTVIELLSRLYGLSQDALRQGFAHGWTISP